MISTLDIKSDMKWKKKKINMDFHWLVLGVKIRKARTKDHPHSPALSDTVPICARDATMIAGWCWKEAAREGKSGRTQNSLALLRLAVRAAPASEDGLVRQITVLLLHPPNSPRLQIGVGVVLEGHCEACLLVIIAAQGYGSPQQRGKNRKSVGENPTLRTQLLTLLIACWRFLPANPPSLPSCHRLIRIAISRYFPTRPTGHSTSILISPVTVKKSWHSAETAGSRRSSHRRQ